MDAPHIFEYVDQDRIIEIYRGKWGPEETSYYGIQLFIKI
jgi:hypothetical protein